MNKVLTKKDVNNAGLRWMVMPMSSFCYEVQFGQAVVYALSPALRKLYPNDEDYLAAINNHFKYFNTQPYMCQIVLGAALGMEEQLGREGAEAIQEFKTGVMGPLAGIGDTLFWVVIPTIWASIASPMALEGNMTGLVLWSLFGVALTLFRLKFFEWGYELGTKLVTSLKSTLQVLTDACSILGLTVVGALIASVVNLKTALILSQISIFSFYITSCISIITTTSKLCPNMVHNGAKSKKGKLYEKDFFIINFSSSYLY